MTQLTVGEVMPQFIYNTPHEENVNIADTVKRVEGKTAIVFLRYIGCTLCQYNLHMYKTNYDLIRETAGQMLIVFQSDPAVVREDIEGATVPFDIICDPTQELYKRFEINAVATKAELFDDEGRKFLECIKAEGFKHGKYEGIETQLPAAFVVDHDLTITYAHYGKLANDIPSAAEIAALL